MKVLNSLYVAPLNHLLAQAPWAAERLRKHSGATLLVLGGPLSIRLQIVADGNFRVCEGELTPDTADVSIELPSDFPVRMLVDRNTLLSAARLSGKADVAETLAFVFRNLSWDIEGDMARVIGDIPARRLALCGDAALTEVREASTRLTANLLEYATTESGMLVSADENQQFIRAVDELRDDLARLEKRLARLGKPDCARDS